MLPWMQQHSSAENTCILYIVSAYIATPVCAENIGEHCTHGFAHERQGNDALEGEGRPISCLMDGYTGCSICERQQRSCGKSQKQRMRKTESEGEWGVRGAQMTPHVPGTPGIHNLMSSTQLPKGLVG